MRNLLASLAGAALCACGQPAEQAAKPPAAPVAAAATGPVACPPWTGKFDPKGPLWLQVARTREGAFVQFSPRGVRRDPVTCETEAQVRILHREAQDWSSADGRIEVAYAKEVLAYRFRCGSAAFLLTQRRFLGQGEKVIHAESYPSDESAWRPISSGGPAAILWGPVCQPPRQ